MRFNIRCFTLALALFSCDNPGKSSNVASTASANKVPTLTADSTGHFPAINTGKTTPAELVLFAQSLKGIPYKYGSTDPNQGFDCSGFVTYVFNHFGILVPRTSVDFTSVDKPINLKDSKPGDLILFTGTDSTIRTVGHMGIIVSPLGSPVSFVHSTSGKAYGVTETPLNSYYIGRFVKVIRVFSQNNF